MTELRSSNTRIAKNTLFLYFRMMLLLVINLYTSRIVLKELGVDDYGIFSVVGGIIVILSFLNNAMTSGTQRFMNVEMGRNDQCALEKVFSTSLQIHIMVAIVVLILAESLGLWFLNTRMNIPEGRMDAANWVYQFSIASAILRIFTVPFNAAIISHEKMSAFAYIGIIEATLKLLVAFAISWAPYDKLIVYACLIFLIGLVNCFICGLYGMTHFVECKNVSFKTDKATMRNMLSFSGWTIFGNLGYILHTQGIAIVVNMFFSVAVNAAQGIANQVNGVVTQFTTNFIVALKPQVVKTYAANELDHMHSLVIRGCKMAFCLMSFFVIPLVLEAPMILQMWLGVVPEYSVIFIRLVLMISLVNSFSSLLSAAKGATGDVKTYQITLTLIGALHIPIAWVAFEFGKGPEYAMYVYLVIVFVLQIMRVLFVCKSVDLSVRLFVKCVILKCSSVLIISSIMPCILHVYLRPSILTTIVVSGTAVMGVIITTLFIALTTSERKTIVNQIILKIK